MGASGKILVIGTFDTKAEEICFLASALKGKGLDAVTIDVSTTDIGSSLTGADVPARDVAQAHPDGHAVVFTGDRGTSVSAMSEAFCEYISTLENLSGVIGIGGSGGTSIMTPAFRSLPIGMPKVMVSTMAAGNMAPYIEASDICVFNPVTDISGLNVILKTVLLNAASALSGMVNAQHYKSDTDWSAIGLTMFGVTTPCVGALRQCLENDNDCLVFHAIGTGGRTLEKLVSEGRIHAVFDITTTEIADEIVGGLLSAGPARLDIFAQHTVPYIGSCGAIDMVNFGARDTVPAAFSDRLFHIHNPNTTLMRTNAEENALIARWIGEKLVRFKGPVRFLVPLAGFSALDMSGQPFHDPAANHVFVSTLLETVRGAQHIEVITLPHHINDPAFAEALVAAYKDLKMEKDL